MSAWTLADQHAAYRQGWGLFSGTIQRLDDPASLEDVVGLEDVASMDEPLFETDAEASAFVIRKAGKGDPLAIKALAAVRGAGP